VTGIIPMAFAAIWAALVADVVVESVEAADGTIAFLGRLLITPGVRPGIAILCALAASTGFAWSVAIASVRRRRREQRMAAELDARSEEIAARAAAAGSLAERVAVLRTSVEELSVERDQLIAEMKLVRRRTSELRALSEDYRRSLAELQDRLIILPEIEDELAPRREARRKAADPSS
jgi:hypothetical protein